MRTVVSCGTSLDLRRWPFDRNCISTPIKVIYRKLHFTCVTKLYAFSILLPKHCLLMSVLCTYIILSVNFNTRDSVASRSPNVTISIPRTLSSRSTDGNPLCASPTLRVACSGTVCSLTTFADVFPTKPMHDRSRRLTTKDRYRAKDRVPQLLVDRERSFRAGPRQRERSIILSLLSP